MENYKIEITEILSKVVNQKANSYEEAKNLVEEKYDSAKIVLEYDDYIETYYKPVPPPNIAKDFKITIEFNKDIQEVNLSQNSNTKKYNCKTIQDLQIAINSYVNSDIELDKIKNNMKVKER